MSDGVAIDEEERQHLTLAYQHVRTAADLHAAEALNIAEGRAWLDSLDLTREDLLSQGLLRGLHRHMYQRVWTWAGGPRVLETNLGVPPAQISDRWEQLLGNVLWWLDQGTFDPDEVCVRLYFGQREIQPFFDGNSRHARVTVNKLAEIIGLAAPGTSRYRWGRVPGADPKVVRVEYLAAVEKARHGDFGPLIEIARRGQV